MYDENRVAMHTLTNNSFCPAVLRDVLFFFLFINLSSTEAADAAAAAAACSSSLLRPPAFTELGGVEDVVHF